LAAVQAEVGTKLRDVLVIETLIEEALRLTAHIEHGPP
jgi:hypothetical protein